MKKFSDSLERELVQASHRLTAQTTEAPTPRRWSHGRRPLVVAAVLAGLGGTAAAAATQPWQPDSFTAAPKGDVPSISSLPAPEKQRRLLEVLRRPAAEADRSPAVDRAVRFAGSAITSGGARTDEIRNLAETPNGPVVLIPLTSWKPSPEPGGLQLDDPLCVLYPDTNGTAKACWTTETLQAGLAFGGLGKRTFGLAPDGVAKVSLQQRSGPDIVAEVKNNFYDAESRGSLPKAVVWLDSDMKPVGP